jgi:hypothetical protein
LPRKIDSKLPEICYGTEIITFFRNQTGQKSIARLPVWKISETRRPVWKISLQRRPVWKKNQRASQCGKPLKQASQPNFRCENRPYHARTTFSRWTRSPNSLSTPARAHFLLSTLARSLFSLSTPAGAQSWLRTPTIGQSVMKNSQKLWNSTDFRQLAASHCP